MASKKQLEKKAKANLLSLLMLIASVLIGILGAAAGILSVVKIALGG